MPASLRGTPFLGCMPTRRHASLHQELSTVMGLVAVGTRCMSRNMFL